MSEIDHRNTEIQSQEALRQSEAQAEESAQLHEQFGRELLDNNLIHGDDYGELEQIKGRGDDSGKKTDKEQIEKELSENNLLDNPQEPVSEVPEKEPSDLESLRVIETDFGSISFDIDEEEKLSDVEFDLTHRTEMDAPLQDNVRENEKNDDVTFAPWDFQHMDMSYAPDDDTEEDFYASELENNRTISAEDTLSSTDQKTDADSVKMEKGASEPGAEAEVTGETENQAEIPPSGDTGEENTTEKHKITVVVEHADGTVSEGAPESETLDVDPDDLVPEKEDSDDQKNSMRENGGEEGAQPDAGVVDRETDGAEMNTENNSAASGDMQDESTETDKKEDTKNSEEVNEQKETDGSAEEAKESNEETEAGTEELKEEEPLDADENEDEANSEEAAEHEETDGNAEEAKESNEETEAGSEGLKEEEPLEADENEEAANSEEVAEHEETDGRTQEAKENNQETGADLEELKEEEPSETVENEGTGDSQKATEPAETGEDTDSKGDVTDSDSDAEVRPEKTESENTEPHRENEEAEGTVDNPYENIQEDQLNAAPCDDSLVDETQKEEWVGISQVKDVLEENDIETEQLDVIVEKVKNGEDLSADDVTFLYDAEKVLRSEQAKDGKITAGEAGNALSHLTTAYYGTEKKDRTSESAVRSGYEVYASADTDVAPWTPPERKEADGKLEDSDASGDFGEKLEKRTLDDISVNEAFEMMKTPESRAELESMIAEQREAIEADWYGMSVDEYREYKELMTQSHDVQKAEDKHPPEEEGTETPEATEAPANDKRSEFKDFLQKTDAILGKVEDFLWAVLKKDFEAIGDTIGTAVGGEAGGVIGKRIMGEVAEAFSDKMRTKPTEAKTDESVKSDAENKPVEASEEAKPDGTRIVTDVLDKVENAILDGMKKGFEVVGKAIGEEIAGEFGGDIGKLALGELAKGMTEFMRSKPTEEKHNEPAKREAESKQSDHPVSEHKEVKTEPQEKPAAPEQISEQKEAPAPRSEADGEEKAPAAEKTDVNDRPKVTFEEVLEKKDLPKVIVDDQPADIWIEVQGDMLLAKTTETTETSFLGIFKSEKTEEKIIGGMHAVVDETTGQINLNEWASAEGTKGVGSVMMDVLQSYARENGYSISAQASGSTGMFDSAFDAKTVNLDDLPQIYHEKFGFEYSPNIDKHMVWHPDNAESLSVERQKEVSTVDLAASDQGNNDFGAKGTCGIVSVANALNMVTGSAELNENEVLYYALGNNLCQKSTNLYELGGTSTGDVVNLINRIADPEQNIHTEVHENSNVLSVEALANRLDEPGTVAIVGVDSATLWDERGDVACSGLFVHESDHWITVDSPTRDEDGNVTGFNIVDSGGGVSYVDRDTFEAMYLGDENQKISDPTAILVSNHGDADVSAPYVESAERHEKFASREGELWAKQGKILQEFVEKHSGNPTDIKRGREYFLSQAEKVELSNLLMGNILSVPLGERGNYRVPEPEKIRGIYWNAARNAFAIDEAWKDGTDGAKENTREMKIIRATDSAGNPTYIDRIGGKGNYFCPMKADGTPYDVISRAIGDRMPEKNIEDNDSYHKYLVKEDFTRVNFEKAIDRYCDKLKNDYLDFARVYVGTAGKKFTEDNPQVTITARVKAAVEGFIAAVECIREDLQDDLSVYYDDALQSSESEQHPNEAYRYSGSEIDGVKSGVIDNMFGTADNPDGGGAQLITPFSDAMLVKLGMIEEVLKEKMQ